MAVVSLPMVCIYIHTAIRYRSHASLQSSANTECITRELTFYCILSASERCLLINNLLAGYLYYLRGQLLDAPFAREHFVSGM